MSTNEVICPICRVSLDEPVNFCPDKTHESFCKECISAYVQNSTCTSFLGSCPQILCPSTSHQSNGSKKRRVLIYDEWGKSVPAEITKRYNELASSLVAFLCGGCHALKSLDVGFESINGQSYRALEKYFNDNDNSCTVQDVVSDIHAYTTGETTVEEMYVCLSKNRFVNLNTQADGPAWDLFAHVLKMIADPERRVNLHLRYLRDRPRIKTLCCHREHCFRCKIKDYHDGKTCMEASSELDHSVVNCPSCGIALAKGDGCNTITCVCGKQFSWSAEKENTDRCVQFHQAFPQETSAQCAKFLCQESNTLSSALLQQAQAWQIRNRMEVTRALQNWFRKTYWPCPSQSVVTLPLDTLPEGVRQAAEIWRTHKPKEVAKCGEQKKIATKSLFLSFYPVESERPAAAADLVNKHRTSKHSTSSSTVKINVRTEIQLLASSAAEWIEANHEEYIRGMERIELQQAQQFLYLHGKRRLHETKPIYVNCPFVYEWHREASNEDLTYSNQNTTVCRVGSVSCYPAAFAKLVGDHSMFRIVVDVAPRTSNWLTFGLARRGMPTTSSDGVGRTANTWGVADDRSSSSMPVVSASGTNVGTFRKFQVGDVLAAEVDTSGGWLEIRLNDNEYSHRFDIPMGNADDYYFAMTFANDHQVTIQCDETSANSSSSTSCKDGIRQGELNMDHTRMFNCFKKQLKSLLVENEEPTVGGSTSANSAMPITAMRTSASKWIATCKDASSATKCYEIIRSELQNLVKFGREFPWRDQPCTLSWVRWNDVLDAASWHFENRIALREERERELASMFYFTHNADAPFIAAITLNDPQAMIKQGTSKTEVQSALAFMHHYPEEMHEWYDYDCASREPMIENIARGCRCLPRHVRNCPRK